MNMLASLSGEQAESKVAALFESEAQARHVATDVRRALRLEPAQVLVVTPEDSHPGRKLEPESHGIFLTILIAHSKLGIAGLIAGLLLFVVLYAMGIAFVVRSPNLALAVIVSFAIVAGLMAGGLVALRPDHDPYLQEVTAALASGQSVVVVHPTQAEQRADAIGYFASMGKRAIFTL